MKVCNKCHKEKDLSDFRPARQRKDGSWRLKSYCRRCEIDFRSPESKERKRAADKERMKKVYGTPERIAIEKRFIEKRKRERMDTWHERNTGMTCAIHWHTCECCGIRTYRIKQAAKMSNNTMCGTCSIKAQNALRIGIKMPLKQCVCPYCSAIFNGKTNRKMCNECKAKRKVEYKREYERRNGGRLRNIIDRAKKYGAHTEKVSKLDVYKRDSWRCYLCGIKVVQSNTYRLDQASIDHVIPLSKGGSHTYDNVRCCCHRCNADKGDSVRHQSTKAHQLTLFDAVRHSSIPEGASPPL